MLSRTLSALGGDVRIASHEPHDTYLRASGAVFKSGPRSGAKTCAETFSNVLDKRCLLNYSHHISVNRIIRLGRVVAPELTISRVSMGMGSLALVRYRTCPT